MAETVDSFETPGGTTWELRESKRGNQYAVSSERTNKQPVSSFNAAKAGAASAEEREEKYGTAQPGENDPTEIEPPDERADDTGIGLQFDPVEIDPDSRGRSGVYEDITQVKAPVGLNLEGFRELIDPIIDNMTDIQISLLDSVTDQYYTHCNWGIEMEVEEKDTRFVVERVVSTPDIHAENIFASETPDTYHPRQAGFPNQNNDPGTRTRFRELANSIREMSYEEITIKTVWVELLKYPQEDQR